MKTKREKTNRQEMMDAVLDYLHFLPPPWARFLAHSACRTTPIPAAVRRALGHDVRGGDYGGRHAA